jgi:hypothetical protein
MHRGYLSAADDTSDDDDDDDAWCLEDVFVESACQGRL